MLSDKDKCLLGYLEATHKMWTWIAEHPEASKLKAIKVCMGDNLEDVEPERIWSECFLCEYVANSGYYEGSGDDVSLDCGHCPLLGIAWGLNEDEDFGGAPCQGNNTPYDKWWCAESPEEIRKAALAMAEGAQQAIYKLTKDKE